MTGYGLKSVLIAGLALTTVACASVQEAPAEGVVVQRAQKRWDALLEGKIDEAYQFLSPGSKAKWGEKEYRSRIGLGLWQGARVARADCSADRCDVHVKVDFRYRRPGMNVVAETAVQEVWVKEEGIWWYVHKR